MRTGAAEDAASLNRSPVVAASEQTVSGRGTDGAGAVGIHEEDAFVGHSLQVGRLDLAVGIARRQVADTHVVGEDDNDVRLLRSRCQEWKEEEY